MWRHNLIVLIATVIGIVVLGLLAGALDPFRRMGVTLELSLMIAAAVFIFIGIAAFLGFDGGFWTRAVLSTVAPAIALPLGELISVLSGEPDGGYRGLSVVVAAIVASIIFLGCVFIGGPIYLWRQRERHLTHQSRADALKRAADF